MQRTMAPSKTLATRILKPATTRVIKPPTTVDTNPCHVFINHRGVDTKRTIAGLLYQHLSSHGLNPFLDSKSMRPGDKLYDKIDWGIKKSRVGVAVFSPSYCESYFCLHELALMMESKKKIVPIFCDVKPSELKIRDFDGSCSRNELKRFRLALDEARYTVGLTFDTSKGDWSEFLTKATDAILQSLAEVEENKHDVHDDNRITKYYDADSS